MSPVFTSHSRLASDLQIPCLTKVALLGLRQAGDEEKQRVMERQRKAEWKEREVVKTQRDG